MEYDFTFENVENFICEVCDGLKFVCEHFELSGSNLIISKTEPMMNKSELKEGWGIDVYFIKGTYYCLFYEEYIPDIIKTVDNIFFQSNQEQRNILALKVIRRFIPVLYCRHFKVSDFLIAACNDIVNTGCFPYASSITRNCKMVYYKKMLMLLGGWRFLGNLCVIFMDYGIDVKDILHKLLSNGTYRHVPFEYRDLMPDELSNTDDVDWRMLCVKADNAGSCDNIQGATKKAPAGATARVQCDVLTALLRAGNFDIPDNNKFASFISWLCGGTFNNIRQRGFYGNLSSENVDSIKEKCSLIGLRYENGKIIQP